MKKTAVIVLVTIGIITFLFYITFIFFLPKNPNAPYLSSQKRRISSIEWGLGMFQPVYLWGYKKDDMLLLKTIYRDLEGRVKFADIFIGGRLGSENYKVAKLINSEKEVVQPDKLKDVTSQFKRGERIQVEYLTSAVITNVQEVREFCESRERICKLATFTEIQDDQKFQYFSQSGLLPDGSVLPALFLFSFVIDETP